MTRKKVKLAFIENGARRKTTYKKRKNGLLKKLGELSTLCGVKACAIICGPDDLEPTVWPSTLGAQHVISQFKSMPKMEQTKKMLNQEIFLRQRIAKVYDQLNKQRKENHNKEITELMFQTLLIGKRNLQNLMLPNLNDLRCKTEEKLKEVNKRLEAVKHLTALQIAPPSPSEPPIPIQL